MLNMTAQELRGLHDLIGVMDEDNRLMNHPTALVRVLMATSTDLVFLEKILPWIREQEDAGSTLYFEDVVKQSLLSFGIREDALNLAIDIIRHYKPEY